jgi:serine/threonine protein kinase
MKEATMAQAVARPGDSLFASILTNSAKYSRLMLRKQLWTWPILAAILLFVVAWFIRGTVEHAVKVNMADNLRTILNADVAALQIWIHTQEEEAVALASSDDVRNAVQGLLEDTGHFTNPENLPHDLLASPFQKALRDELKSQIESDVYCGFVLFNTEYRILAANRDELVGQKELPLPFNMAQTVAAGKPGITRPVKSSVLLRSVTGETRAGVPTMFSLAPVRDKDGKLLAVLALRIRPEDDFTRILAVGRAGITGETFAFDSSGLLLSMSRFDDQLKEIGLLPDDDQAQSILNVELRNPQVNMAEGERPELRRREQPLTQIVTEAVQNVNKEASGVNVEGYRDYRGVPVIGAWTWLPKFGIGVATEMDISEAYHPLNILRMAFWGLFALLVVGAIAIFVFTIIVAKLRRSLQKEALKAQRLGQYVLEEKLGAGGMGVVYRAHHTMLRRPTAVKLLNIEKTTDASIARFEREVQLTSLLTHPNTIAIYDYGRTPEGIFYYAMEYLDGISLDQLIDRFGPQPEARVVQIIRQVCGSLAEAHAAGLIHRDIKPANIMLTQRGGIPDVAKVLDFGLAKTLDARHNSSLTSTGMFAGTPLYLSPEALESGDKVDARSDLYAVGAVAYSLITGTPPFIGNSIAEVCVGHINKAPDRLAVRLGRPVSENLEKLILRCLAKSPAERPQSAEELANALDQCNVPGTWTKQEAAVWWQTHKDHTGLQDSKSPTNHSSTDETIIHDGILDAKSIQAL